MTSWPCFTQLASMDKQKKLEKPPSGGFFYGDCPLGAISQQVNLAAK